MLATKEAGEVSLFHLLTLHFQPRFLSLSARFLASCFQRLNFQLALTQAVQLAPYLLAHNPSRFPGNFVALAASHALTVTERVLPLDSCSEAPYLLVFLVGVDMEVIL